MSREQAGGPNAQQALSGIRVLELAHVIAGPTACQILADFGADVLKIEDPERGDSLRGVGHQKNDVPLWWATLGRNKRSVCIDLRHPEGQLLLLTLVEQCDVVVESFRPGTLERWGLGYDELRKANPDVILTRLSGFGQTGPYCERPAFGTLIEAMSGFAAMTGEPDGPPALPPYALADNVAGLTAALATMVALHHRNANQGGGQVVDVSILEPMMMASLGAQILAWDTLGVVERRTGNRVDFSAPRNLYRTGDDKWVAVSAATGTVFERIMGAVGPDSRIRPEWFESQRRRAEDADVIDAVVAEWILGQSQQEVLRIGEEAAIPIAPVFDVVDIVDDPHMIEREVVTRVSDPRLGSVLTQNVVFRMSETPGSIRHLGQELGAATDEVLHEVAGLSPDQIASLRDSGAIG